MVHAHGGPGAEAAARAGVTSIEHGLFLDGAALGAMQECGTVFVPTLLASARLVDHAGTEVDAERMRTVAQGHRAVVREAHRLGVTIAMGTDCPVAAHGRNLEELSLLAECGLSPTEALVSATSNPGSTEVPADRAR